MCLKDFFNEYYYDIYDNIYKFFDELNEKNCYKYKYDVKIYHKDSYIGKDYGMINDIDLFDIRFDIIGTYEYIDNSSKPLYNYEANIYRYRNICNISLEELYACYLHLSTREIENKEFIINAISIYIINSVLFKNNK